MFVPRSVSKSSRQKAPKPTLNETSALSVSNKSSSSLGSTSHDDALRLDSDGAAVKDYVKSSTHPSQPDETTSDGAVAADAGVFEQDEGGPIVCYSKQQRWAEPGEPVCIVCGRYGEYIVDRTDRDVCSLECKAKDLHRLGLPLTKHEEVAKKESDVQQKSETKASAIEGRSCDGWRYREHNDIAALTNSQVADIKKKYSISVRGGGAPRPITEFSHLGLPSQVLANLCEREYVRPSPVQMQTVPAALAGRDLLVCATTGSGKTLSFLLPLLLSIVGSSTSQTRGGQPQALVLTPTRELAMQIETQAKQLMKGVPMMRTALIVGGVPLAQQLHRLRSGVQVLIATPARLNDIIVHHSGEIELMDIVLLVVDEVDCLLQMGFENQFYEIEEFLPKRRQNLMFSATIPRKIEKMASKLMNQPLYICIGEPSVPCDSIKHTVIWVEENSKRKKLLALLDDPKHFKPPAVVFVSSKMGTLLLTDAINNKTRPHISAVCIHGDMAQERRSEVVRGCMDGKYSIVVATNILGRGLDLVSVREVIIFDMPHSITEFIHQVGRAGRQGSPGSAYTFINNSNKTVFVELATLLQSQEVHLPPQLANSPHLKAQVDKRKRLLESGSDQQGGGGKRPTTNSYHNQSTLLNIIKANSKKRTVIKKQ